MVLPGLRQLRPEAGTFLPGRPGAVAGQRAIGALAFPRPVGEVEHAADRAEHELGVADIQVELADQAAVLVGDGDGRLDRARRDALSLNRTPYSANRGRPGRPRRL